MYKRDKGTHLFIEGEYSIPEFEYLRNNTWLYTEKLDGTNIRVQWDPCPEGDSDSNRRLMFRGRTDNAQMYPGMLERLEELFAIETFDELYPETPLCLYGEGIGAHVQKGGGRYIHDGVDFVLFDVLVGRWWLRREDVAKFAKSLNINIAPIVGRGTLLAAVELIKRQDFTSSWGDFLLEGFVLRPIVELQNRGGKRIITKVKHKDFPLQDEVEE
ncbi:MAG: RNA ligase family protein [Euryarchaeota archaeon]|nr:RNA ligase family protein [Euryarchaeota archaeon]